MSDRVKSGIYIITNTVTGDCYIGSSVNAEKRLTQHRNLLRMGRHHSKRLQEAWDRDGEGEFVFDVLELVLDVGRLVDLEQRYLDERQPVYNAAKIALRNGAGIVTDPDELARRRDSARTDRLAMMAVYDELNTLRATINREDDIMSVLGIARSLSSEERRAIEESGDLAARLYHQGSVSGREYLNVLDWLAHHPVFHQQFLIDEWRARGLTPQEIAPLSQHLYALVNGIPERVEPPAMTMTELALNALASTVAHELHVRNDSHGLPKIASDVDIAGRIAGDTRRQIEQALDGQSVVSSRNMVQEPDGGLWAQLPAPDTDEP